MRGLLRSTLRRLDSRRLVGIVSRTVGATYSAEAAGTAEAAAASFEAPRPHRRNGAPCRLVTRAAQRRCCTALLFRPPGAVGVFDVENEGPRFRGLCPTGAAGLEPATPGFGGLRESAAPLSNRLPFPAGWAEVGSARLRWAEVRAEVSSGERTLAQASVGLCDHSPNGRPALGWGRARRRRR
jgi:hypothetical protein